MRLGLSPPPSLEACLGLEPLAIKKKLLGAPLLPFKVKFPLSHLLSAAVLIEFQICAGPDR